jgi:hypothetical protein
MAKTIKPSSAEISEVTAQRSLPEALAGKYELIPGFPTLFACELGEIDISKITAEQAEHLAVKGFLKSKS